MAMTLFNMHGDDGASLASSPVSKAFDEISLTLLEEGVGSYDILQRALPSIVLSKIDQTKIFIEDNDCTIERLLKMFRIAQLQIEYILKTQAELVKQVEQLQDRFKFVSTENSKLRKELVSGPETINSLFKHLETKHRMHESYTLMNFHNLQFVSLSPIGDSEEF
ncbi:unnamed protein product [Litomosoides sigmodontis]|uniref:Cilium assembly protein DZIP1 N-terminal domain-containing protein n=1 Tax=Litomosoides sigmodontis TaxID=42156 RepID=A0A3P6V749_LITSI|nr:unnamed protein product [Litomosoides sigmodontis]